MALIVLKNAFVNQETESRHFYACPTGKTPPRFLSSPHKHREITHPPSSIFFSFKNLFLPSVEKGVEETVLLFVKNSKTKAFIRFFFKIKKTYCKANFSLVPFYHWQYVLNAVSKLQDAYQIKTIYDYDSRCLLFIVGY